MTMLLALLAVSAVSFSAGWRAASHFQIAQRQAHRDLTFLLRSPIDAVILAGAE